MNAGNDMQLSGRSSVFHLMERQNENVNCVIAFSSSTSMYVFAVCGMVSYFQLQITTVHVSVPNNSDCSTRALILPMYLYFNS